MKQAKNGNPPATCLTTLAKALQRTRNLSRNVAITEDTSTQFSYNEQRGKSSKGPMSRRELFPATFLAILLHNTSEESFQVQGFDVGVNHTKVTLSTGFAPSAGCTFERSALIRKSSMVHLLMRGESKRPEEQTEKSGRMHIRFADRYLKRFPSNVKVCFPESSMWLLLVLTKKRPKCYSRNLYSLA